MALEIIGAGFGRTGTVSMKAALEILGFGPCYHMREILQRRPGYNDGHLELWSEHARARQAGQRRDMDWDRIFARYASCMDHPRHDERLAWVRSNRVPCNPGQSENGGSHELALTG